MPSAEDQITHAHSGAAFNSGEMKMRHVATVMIAAALAVSASGPADASWKKFWKQAGDKKCWEKIAKNDAYVQQNCKL